MKTLINPELAKDLNFLKSVKNMHLALIKLAKEKRDARKVKPTP